MPERRPVPRSGARAPVRARPARSQTSGSRGSAQGGGGRGRGGEQGGLRSAGWFKLLRGIWRSIPNGAASERDGVIRGYERFSWALVGIAVATPLAAAVALALAPTVVAIGAAGAAGAGVARVAVLARERRRRAVELAEPGGRALGGGEELPVRLSVRVPIRLSRPGGEVVTRPVEFVRLPGSERTWRSVEPVAAVQRADDPGGPVYHRALRLLPSLLGDGPLPPRLVRLHTECERCRRRGESCRVHAGIGGGREVHVLPVENPSVSLRARYWIVGWASDFPSSGDPSHDEPPVRFA